MLMRSYFLVHSKEENVLCVHQKILKHIMWLRTTARKMLIISASVLLYRGDKFESCEFLGKIFCECLA